MFLHARNLTEAPQFNILFFVFASLLPLNNASNSLFLKVRPSYADTWMPVKPDEWIKQF